LRTIPRGCWLGCKTIHHKMSAVLCSVTTTPHAVNALPPPSLQPPTEHISAPATHSVSTCLPVGAARTTTARAPTPLLLHELPHTPTSLLLLLLRQPPVPLHRAPLAPVAPATAAAAAGGCGLLLPLLLLHVLLPLLCCSAATPQPSFSASDQSITSVLSTDCISSIQAGNVALAAAAATLLLLIVGGSI
jgi:hypothetical protein